MWTEGSVNFHFGKVALAFLPTARFVALRPLFLFGQAQYVLVFPLKPTPFCKLFAGFGSTRKSIISLPFSFFPILSLPLPLCLLLCLSFYLNLSGRSDRNCLIFLPLQSSYKGCPDTHFSRLTTRLLSWPDGKRYCFPLQSLVVSLFLHLVSTLVFSRLEAYYFIQIL